MATCMAFASRSRVISRSLGTPTGAGGRRALAIDRAAVGPILDKFAVRGVVGAGVCLSQPIMWGEMDAFAHLNSCSYFVHIETARMKYFEAINEVAKALDETWDEAGFLQGRPGTVGPILASATCRFRRPCKYPETVHTFATVDPQSVDESRFTMLYSMFSDSNGAEMPVATAESDIVLVDYSFPDAPAKAAIPGALREAMGLVDSNTGAIRSLHGHHERYRC